MNRFNRDGPYYWYHFVLIKWGASLINSQTERSALPCATLHNSPFN